MRLYARIGNLTRYSAPNRSAGRAAQAASLTPSCATPGRCYLIMAPGSASARPANAAPGALDRRCCMRWPVPQRSCRPGRVVLNHRRQRGRPRCRRRSWPARRPAAGRPGRIHVRAAGITGSTRQARSPGLRAVASTARSCRPDRVVRDHRRQRGRPGCRRRRCPARRPAAGRPGRIHLAGAAGTRGTPGERDRRCRMWWPAPRATASG